MPKLLILRHGQSQYNAESRFCGWIDAPLTTTGRKQAGETALLLETDESTKDVPIHVLVTSRLQRAVETANIILGETGRMDMDVVKTWRLNERHYGAFQGVQKSDVLKEHGEEMYKYYRRAYDGCPPPCDPTSDCYVDTLRIAKFDNELAIDSTLVPHCESLAMVIERLKPFWESKMLVTLSEGKNVLCVTHGSVVRALITILYNLTHDEVEHLNIPNGMPILIDFDDITMIPKKWVYLEPERAKIEAERVKHEGLH